MSRSIAIKNVASTVVSAAVGALCGLMALGLTSVPLFDNRPSPFGQENPNADVRVELLYWMVLATFHAIATAFVLVVWSLRRYKPSAVGLVGAIVVAFISVPLCVGLGTAMAFASDVGKIAIVLAPALFGVLWTTIYRLATGLRSLVFGIAIGALLLPCFLADTYKYVVLFSITSALLCAWQGFARPAGVVAAHGVA